jgi:hypothetical protein
MSENIQKEKPPEVCFALNSKFRRGEPWPEEMFAEAETQATLIQASEDSGLVREVEPIEPPLSVSAERTGDL